MKRFRKKFLRILGLNECYYLQRAVREVNNLLELKKLFGWNIEPLLDDSNIYEFDNELDLNERRLRDAQSLATIIRNTNPAICLDIGTAEGHSAALMAVNAPQAQIYTINIPPEEILSGDGRRLYNHCDGTRANRFLLP